MRREIRAELMPLQANPCLQELARFVTADAAQLALQGEMPYPTTLPGFESPARLEVVRFDSVNTTSWKGVFNRVPYAPSSEDMYSIWLQLDGETLLRMGNSWRRQRDTLRLGPEQAVAIHGNARRSFENPTTEQVSLGALVRVLK